MLEKALNENERASCSVYFMLLDIGGQARTVSEVLVLHDGSESVLSLL